LEFWGSVGSFDEITLRRLKKGHMTCQWMIPLITDYSISNIDVEKARGMAFNFVDHFLMLLGKFI
jgi:hypothetical protein